MSPPIASAAAVKAPAEAQVTDAEKILIRALASARQIQPGEGISQLATVPTKSSIRRAKPSFALQSEGLHRGLATESLVDALLDAGQEIADVMELPCADSDRRMLASLSSERGRRT